MFTPFSDLLCYRFNTKYQNLKTDANGDARIYFANSSFTELFYCCIYLNRNYDKNDQDIQITINERVKQLKIVDFRNSQVKIFDNLSLIIPFENSGKNLLMRQIRSNKSLSTA